MADAPSIVPAVRMVQKLLLSVVDIHVEIDIIGDVIDQVADGEVRHIVLSGEHAVGIVQRDGAVILAAQDVVRLLIELLALGVVRGKAGGVHQGVKLGVVVEAGLGGGISGVEEGIDVVIGVGVEREPALQQALHDSCSLEEAGCHALMAMMAVSEDTALLHRAGPEGWVQASAKAAQLLQTGITKETLEQTDDCFIANNWSPGGSADLLAVCYLLHFLEKEML